jgi:methyl-accepting chemotaxis protein
MAVAQLDQMTQQNAAMVEQSSAAASSMGDQAQRLVDAVQIFSA